MRGGWLALLTAVGLAGSASALELLEESALRFDLPDALREVSGLTFQGPDTLWAHDDERATVYALDPATGEVMARRVLGPRPVQGDFEGIAWDGDFLHLVTSGGTLVSFRPGSGATVESYGVRETAAGAWCEVEGVALDPERHTLVLACKTVRMDGVEAGLLLLEVDRPPGPTAQSGTPLPVRVALSLTPGELAARDLPRRLALSDLAYDASRRSWLLVAAQQGRVLEVSRDGQILGSARIRSGRHPQAEGLALAPDGSTLYLADEGGSGRARLTAYGARPDGTGR